MERNKELCIQLIDSVGVDPKRKQKLQDYCYKEAGFPFFQDQHTNDLNPIAQSAEGG